MTAHHSLHKNGNLVWCGRCGVLSQGRKVQHLRNKCDGKPSSGYTQKRLLRMNGGLHLYTAALLEGVTRKIRVHDLLPPRRTRRPELLYQAPPTGSERPCKRACVQSRSCCEGGLAMQTAVPAARCPLTHSVAVVRRHTAAVTTALAVCENAGEFSLDGGCLERCGVWDHG